MRILFVFVLVLLLAACGGESDEATQTPYFIILTATEEPPVESVVVPTQTPHVIIVTATPEPATPTPQVIVVTATPGAILETAHAIETENAGTLAAFYATKTEEAWATREATFATASQAFLDATATAEAATEEATQYSRDCQLPVGAFEILNANPCLDNPIPEEQQPDVTAGIVIQNRPETYQLHNRLETADGLSGEEHHTNPMPIDVDEDGYQFGVGFVAGEAGYETTLTVHEPICLFVQAFGAYRIDDPDYHGNRSNYALRAWIEKQNGAEVDLGMAAMPEATNGDIEPFWAVQVTEPGVYTIGVGVLMRYATAPSGAWVRLESIGIAENTDGGFCGEFTPEI